MSNKLKKLRASQKKRIAYLEKYRMDQETDMVMLQLEKAISAEERRAYRTTKQDRRRAYQ